MQKAKIKIRKMKKIILGVSIAAASLTGISVLNSCDRAEEIVDEIAVPVPFDLPLSFQTTIPFATVTTSGYITYPEITTDIDVNAKIKEQYPKLSIDNLKSAKATSLKITLDNATLGGKLDAVKNARVYIKTPNLQKKLVGTILNNTNPDQLIFNTLSGEELIEYLRSPQNSLILEIQGQQLLLDEFTITIEPTFKISVGI